MAAPDPRTLPRLSAGSLDGLLVCPRRLAAHLAPEPDRPRRPRQHDGPFRLANALRASLHDAHRAASERDVPVGDVLDTEEPEWLSVEERAVFERALAAYADAHGDDRVELVDLGLDSLEAEGPGGAHLLTGQPFLVVRVADGTLELRTLHLGRDPRRSIGDGPRTADVVNARLILRAVGTAVPRAGNDRLLRVARLAIRPHAQLWHTEVRVDDLDRVRARILEAVADVTAASGYLDERLSTHTGWWCADCAVVRGCPAIAQDPLAEVHARMEVAQ